MGLALVKLVVLVRLLLLVTALHLVIASFHVPLVDIELLLINHVFLFIKTRVVAFIVVVLLIVLLILVFIPISIILYCPIVSLRLTILDRHLLSLPVALIFTVGLVVKWRLPSSLLLALSVVIMVIILRTS